MYILQVFGCNAFCGRLKAAMLAVAPSVIALAGVLAGTASTSWASVILVPPGLALGTQYRIVVVTADLYASTDTVLADYNAEVNNEMNNLSGDTGSLLAGLGASWTAIGSSSSISAITNVGIDSGVAIYDDQGNKIANDASTATFGLFSGTILHVIDHTETGGVYSCITWTGSTASGGIAAGGYLGVAGTNATFTGYTETTGATWLDNGNGYSGIVPLYAISTVLTVAPEPGTEGLVVGGLAMMLAVARKRKNAPNFQQRRSPVSRCAPARAG